jgi:hypothetical protein
MGQETKAGEREEEEEEEERHPMAIVPLAVTMNE